MVIYKLSYTEREICDVEERKAYFSKSLRYSDIAFVYFIYHRNAVIYIGCTRNPHIREMNHSKTLYEKKGIKKYVIEFIGPFPYDLALRIEAAEISRRSHKKSLLNKSCKKKIYDKEKKFSIENYRQKSVSFIREGGDLKKVVC